MGGELQYNHDEYDLDKHNFVKSNFDKYGFNGYHIRYYFGNVFDKYNFNKYDSANQTFTKPDFIKHTNGFDKCDCDMYNFDTGL